MKKKMKTTTLRELREHKACSDQYKHLREQLGDSFGDDQPLSLIKILELNGVQDCLRAFRCFGNNAELGRIAVKFTVFNAEEVIDIFKSHDPDNDAPVKAIEAAKAYLENPDAASATFAAFAAGYAASAAGYAALAAKDARYATSAALAASAAASVAALAAAAAGYAASATARCAGYAIGTPAPGAAGAATNLIVKKQIAKLSELLHQKGFDDPKK